MSWYDNAWLRRQSITVDTIGGGGTVDITIAVPVDWDQFWNEINQTDGRDIRICDADGRTLLTYNLESFSLATRTLIIEVDAYAAPGLGMCQIWIYWNKCT